MRLFILILLISPLAAQELLDSRRIALADQGFDDARNQPKLQCEIRPMSPQLDFAFRFQAGYVTWIPMKQYSGRGHYWITVMRIRPDAGDRKSVYLAGREDLPDIPSTRQVFRTAGAFLVGQGGYHIDWLLYDDQSRVCRKSWHFDAKLTRADRNVKLLVTPNTVGPVTMGGNTRDAAPDDARRIRITILLHVAPLNFRRNRLSWWDRALLMSTLASLLDNVPTQSIRVVAFNLDQQRELFRDDDFKPQSYMRLYALLDSVQLGTVDYRVLKNPSGHVALLKSIVDREFAATPSSDAIVFLGPGSRYESRKLPEDAVFAESPSSPKLFFFRYETYGPWTSFAEPISLAVKQLGGKTIAIRTPGEFATAIKTLKSSEAEAPAR